MNSVTKEQFAATYGTQALSAFQPLSQPPQTYTQRVASSFKTDLDKRVEAVGRIQSSNASPLSKATQTFGQGAGLAANAIESTVGEIPGVKQGLAAIGQGINRLATSKPIVKIADAIGDNQTLQELTKFYDNDQEFKDTVDSVANIFRLGGDLAVGGTAGKAPRAAAQGIKVPALKVPQAVKGVAKDVLPSADRVVNSQVSKALELTAGDIKNINLSTGNEPGRFLADHNLIGANVDETVKNITTFKDTNYNQVRTEIGKVTKDYTPAQIPRFHDALKQIEKQVTDVPGLEKVAVEVDNLLNARPTYALNDVQRVKELLDEHFDLYKVTGDVKESATKQGIANMRRELKEFIEKQTKQATGVDIKPLNNNVQTTRSLLDAIEERSTRGLTRSNIRIGDFGTAGIALGFTGNPALALAAVIGKRIVESPTVALRFARMVDKFSDAQKLKFKQEIAAGKVPQELEDLYSESLSSNRSSAVNGSTIENNSNIGSTISQRSNVIPKTVPQEAPIKKSLLQRAREAGSFIKNSIGDESGKIKNPFAGDTSITPETVAKNINGEDIPLIRNYVSDPSLKNLLDLEPLLRAAGLENLDLTDLQRFLKEVVSLKNEI